MNEKINVQEKIDVLNKKIDYPSRKTVLSFALEFKFHQLLGEDPFQMLTENINI